jgi:hypothetical protein
MDYLRGAVHKERLSRGGGKGDLVFMGEEKTNEERHLGGGGGTSPYKWCKTSFVNSPISVKQSRVQSLKPKNPEFIEIRNSIILSF